MRAIVRMTIFFVLLFGSFNPGFAAENVYQFAGKAPGIDNIEVRTIRAFEFCQGLIIFEMDGKC